MLQKLITFAQELTELIVVDCSIQSKSQYLNLLLSEYSFESYYNIFSACYNIRLALVTIYHQGHHRIGQL